MLRCENRLKAVSFVDVRRIYENFFIFIFAGSTNGLW
jgi:hypothetical protein